MFTYSRQRDWNGWRGENVSDHDLSGLAREWDGSLTYLLLRTDLD